MQHFDIAVIGSGSGNSIIDERFSHLDVALIEDNPVFGGTCLNRGCIPTKMFVVAAESAMAPRQAARLGVDLDFKGADWPAIRDRVFGRIDPISAAGREWRRNGPGVTLFEGHASFVDAHTLLVGDVQISADQIVIATGSRPRPLSIEVPEELRSRFYTSDDVMRIAELPRRLIVLGGGFVACEFAQIFAGLGSQVTQINRSEVLLRGEDHEVSEAFKEEQAKFVNLILNQKISAAETGPDGEVLVITTDRNGVEYEYLADAVLVATGRVRNSDSLNLAAAGVEVGPGGQIRVDKYQRTSQPGIWALGDVSSNYLLKHVANAEARTVAANLLAGDGDLVATDHRYVPHAVFTDPQIASVGATEQQLREWGTPYVVARQRYADVAYGWALEDEGHFVKLLADPRTWHLLGAHIIGPQAATLIQPMIQAMSLGNTVQELARGQYWIHPALPEVLENALLGLLKEAAPKELEN
jgi:mycothione reductase